MFLILRLASKLWLTNTCTTRTISSIRSFASLLSLNFIIFPRICFWKGKLFPPCSHQAYITGGNVFSPRKAFTSSKIPRKYSKKQKTTLFPCSDSRVFFTLATVLFKKGEGGGPPFSFWKHFEPNKYVYTQPWSLTTLCLLCFFNCSNISTGNFALSILEWRTERHLSCGGSQKLPQ